MSNVEKFEELLRSDKTLQAKLTAAMEAFGGNKNDEAEVFDAVIAPLAAAVGLPFTLEDAKSVAADGAELDDDELDSVAGGGTCFILGASGDVSAKCALGGVTCAYLGVTLNAD